MKIFSSKVYDILKWIIITFIPALNALIFTISALLGFDATVICGIITAIQAFLGALMGIDYIGYKKQISKEN